MATKIVFSPPMPKDIMDEARAMVPTGYELVVVDRSVPNALDAHRDAEYFVGFARGDMGPDFYQILPKLKLVQLISAGYDRLDVAAAKKAGVPVANNGGANSTAVAEHTWLLILGVLKRLAWQHANVVAGKWRIGDLAENRLYEVSGKTLGIVASAPSARRWRAAPTRSRCRRSTTTPCASPRTRRTPSTCASCSSTSCSARPTW